MISFSKIDALNCWNAYCSASVLVPLVIAFVVINSSSANTVCKLT